ncbi:PEPxxWA-CTERM sorting domain-containing protein [Phenylobacterium sp.]|uniref:PEPxxWA-CTERM sorting domain-containing protein n=1 Tax=Phenylobacterium sp. TaxID=1871053 RepID=UPI002C005AD8|nr:PEPxxWA-CTERM sorting domain-containing protein [Phenylobacterium sp.]HLZ73855.1 PEPxxWA-CTERM sorting domain-containing protein [Phenylobacterium sp.]
MTLRSLLLIAVSTATLAGAQAAQAATNLLTNGGFDDIGAGAVPEGWGGLTYYTDGTHPGHVALPGWTVEAGSVDLTSTSSGWGPADMGPYSLDINGWSAGTISQQFATVAGQTYNVSYAFSRNEAGSPNDPVQATVAAGGVSRLISVSYEDPSFGSIGHMLWHHGGFSFVGDGNEATIRLAAVTDSNAGVFFDTVSVTGGVPEPAAWALMIVGFGGVGAVLRSRRRAAPATA